MKLTCPKDPAHVRFVVSVRTRETWIVDRVGHWIANIPDAVEVDHYPSFSDDFECEECGAYAAKDASEAKVSP